MSDVNAQSGPSSPRIETDGVDPAVEARVEYALRLIDACLANDFDQVRVLVSDVGADCWIQDQQGWTALHAAAYTGNVDMIEYLLRSGNAVWQMTDNLGLTAGDIAYSMNKAVAYDFLLQEGARAEMIRSAIEIDQDQAADETGQDTDMTDLQHATAPERTTASDNATYLASKLRFITDGTGQEIAVDEQGIGVMMGWERPIMRKTADLLCHSHADRKGKARAELDETETEFNVVNVGFGLGIIDTYLQDYNPTTHLIIEPHPDVLEHAKSKGFMDKPGVRFFEGTWQQYLKALERGEEEYLAFDAIYFDTYSEHYVDLHRFFDCLPNMLRDEMSTFSFFHGLGATSRHLYDTYTLVSEMHLRETGLKTEWTDVEVGQIEWDATSSKYWEQSVVGPYRLPICTLDF
ncbi:Arginine N-methyltransferase 2 [Microbotryomycetes sp. JL201]|nr:Arginine N-methyltransferase 2 [Microbotryomycetes sp. JL201]